ncbi:hypothetical protein [Planotetraspora kaengkrachanensis]|uniref:Uncharacterized protein n=1 Tax=Planotetraspora kaengkrachanensis TaxID=575193 RepID=A0A8J3PQT6_9ACTN|nr:hypothetical protein [Planotetraspora kaengkrachanensis]GIG77749.1 hypothetical protein Pka01_08760 [Planotetraspora kaengkrachanensis]
MTNFGCSLAAQGKSGPTRVNQLAFAFHRINPSGYMDQTLDIVNKGPSAVIPTLEITAVDRTGAALPGVTVSTAYGSDQAKMVVPAREISIDVLAFTGGDAASVADVRVTVRGMADAAFPVAPQEVEAQAVDGAGRPTTKFGPFDAVVLTNPNHGKVSAGVVCIFWEQPPDGQPQQARAVIPVGVTTVEGDGSATIRASGETRNGCDSLKVYFSPPI